MVEVMKIMVTSFKKSLAGTATLSGPDPAAGDSQASLGQSVVGSLLSSPGSWCAQGFVCALQESVSPVLCKFLCLYDLLQEGLCHTQVYCTQSPCPCSRPLLTCTSTGDTQTQIQLSVCGVSGSWCTQGLFEPSECLWWVWGLILNVHLYVHIHRCIYICVYIYIYPHTHIKS